MSKTASSSVLPDLETPHAIIVSPDRHTGVYWAQIFVGDIVRGTLRDIEDLQRERVVPVAILGPHGSVSEKGFPVREGEPTENVAVFSSGEPVRMLLDDFQEQIGALWKMRFEHDDFHPLMSDEAFASKVRQIQREMIGGGRVCQLVFSRPFHNKITAGTPHDAFGEILRIPKTAMTSFFAIPNEHTGDMEYVAHASPETLFDVYHRKTTFQPVARMRPIAGTMWLRAWVGMSEVEFQKHKNIFLKRALEFINDEKEKYELMMVLDEHLKQMMFLCREGTIRWPFTKVAGAALHTEFEIIGKLQDVQNILTQKLLTALGASTLYGGPLREAFACVMEIEDHLREFYGGYTAVYNPNDMLNMLTSAINLRWFHIRWDDVYLRAGAGVVYHSDPESEAIETCIKTAWVGNALESEDVSVDPVIHEFISQSRIPNNLNRRRTGLSDALRSWKNLKLDPSLLRTVADKKVTLINCDDDFVYMTARILQNAGMHVDVVHYTQYDHPKHQENSDIILLGPGPGDLSDDSDVRISKLKQLGVSLTLGDTPLYGICLGHQILADTFAPGSVRRLSQSCMGMVGEHVGFLDEKDPLNLAAYNSIAVDPNHLGIQTNFDFTCHQIRPWEEVVVSMQHKGWNGLPRIRTTQMHPESAMSPKWAELLIREMWRLLGWSPKR